ncbi:hypothetical protein PHBOTO_004790 [Pseudozyma hubeiensis]|nr:hypothetical protein PHBOTO_004790 [Pseudozyma hubeiensis]
MDEILRELDGVHTVIDTEQSTLRKYVVALEYFVDDKAGTNGSNASSSRKRKADTLRGTFSVTVGCKDAWWGADVQGLALASMVRSGVIRTGGDPEEPTHEECQLFADKFNSAFSRQSIMVGVKKTASLDTSRSASTRNVDSTPSLKLHQLQRKYEAAQQALREERHKYRSLLAAPSAANARGSGRRPVVGLDPMLQRASQRSPSMVQQTPSSPSTRSGLPSSSSSSGITGPSSDDLQDVPPSQRTLSLVNPTRVRRADPGENQGFLGDSDEDL